MELIKLLLSNWDALMTLFIVVIAVVKLTGWGRANAEALQTVVTAVEKTAAHGIEAGSVQDASRPLRCSPGRAGGCCVCRRPEKETVAIHSARLQGSAAWHFFGA